MHTAIFIISLSITTLFYVAYLGKQLVLRRRGIAANRLTKGDKPAGARKLEAALTAITFLMPAAQYFSIFTMNRSLPIVYPAPLYLQIAGCVMAGTGVAYFICAITAMRDNWQAGIDASQHTELVETGIYRLSRNPAFTGFGLLYIGITLVCPNLLTIILTVAGLVLFHLQVLAEEKYLAATFGERYESYRRRVFRY